MAQAIQCSQFGRKGSVPQGVGPSVVKSSRAVFAAALTLVAAVPPSQADPVDALTAFTDRTIAYLQDFNPLDNATTQQAKTASYLDDLVLISNLLNYVLCYDFIMGPIYVTTNFLKLDTVNFRLDIEVPGFGANSQRTGVGMYSIIANGNAGGNCHRLI